MADKIRIEDFLLHAPARLAALEKYGFKRIEAEEEVCKTFASLVYRGQHVAFVFSFDLPAQCFDAEVVKVLGGKLLRDWDAGYSDDIYGHLIQREGYRGGMGNTFGEIGGGESVAHVIQAMDSWVGLLEKVGRKLLIDAPDSLS